MIALKQQHTKYTQRCIFFYTFWFPSPAPIILSLKTFPKGEGVFSNFLILFHVSYHLIPIYTLNVFTLPPPVWGSLTRWKLDKNTSQKVTTDTMHNLNGHKEEFKSSEEDLKEPIITPKKLQIKFLPVHAPLKGIHKLKGVRAQLKHFVWFFLWVLYDQKQVLFTALNLFWYPFKQNWSSY